MKTPIRLYFPKLFWFITVLKIVCATYFASDYVTKGFLPFIEYFIKTAHNPYDIFYHHVVFPYPSGMLYIFSLVLFLAKLCINGLFTHTHLLLLLFRVPILIADIIIYVILCNLLPSKEKKVLLLYFASPILFYINYYHGQLDVVPTAFLFVSLYYLSIKKQFPSYVMLGLGIATKTHLLIVIPFYFIYLIKQKEPYKRIVIGIMISIFIFFLINLPMLSTGFLKSVFNNAEQQRLFFVTFPYQYNDLALLIAPAGLFFILYKFASYKKLNYDSLILILGLVFTILVALVPPMQGWFYWSIPLLIFFLIKYKDSQPLSFWMMNVFFLLFFFFIRDSDIFQSASITFRSLINYVSPYIYLQSHGVNALLLQNLLFTGLQVSVMMNAFWCYRIGIYHNNLYMEKEKPFVFGIAGDSSVGKSTMSQNLQDVVGKNNLIMLNGDDAHKWERSDNNWQIFTHLNPSANKLHTDAEHLYALIDGNSIERVLYNHKTGKFNKPKVLKNNQHILFQGLHPFILENMRPIYDLKIYVEAEEKLRIKWKLERDTKKRGHSSVQVKNEIKRRTSDAKKFIYPQKQFADWIIYYNTFKGNLRVNNSFKNSVPLDAVAQELAQIPSLQLSVSYLDMNYQQLNYYGSVKKSTIERIAYKLYPNLNELFNNYPTFHHDIKGIQQLLFINYINFYYIQKQRNNGRFY